MWYTPVVNPSMGQVGGSPELALPVRIADQLDQIQRERERQPCEIRWRVIEENTHH